MAHRQKQDSKILGLVVRVDSRLFCYEIVINCHCEECSPVNAAIALPRSFVDKRSAIAV